ncbi:HPr family phosphocarrier protein [Mesorhizobium sp. VNQ89]|uniref:HPr family phosphocarrier protein n=1 Tax=Mesorhizobium quangtriensis TaxID=3157709 RepID=UPI0032B7A192
MSPGAGTDVDGAIARDFLIINQRGLHARASAKFVQLADSFQASISVEKDGIKVGGTSIMGLMMLAASPGCSIRVTANGPEAEAAITAIEQLIAARFGEEA